MPTANGCADRNRYQCGFDANDGGQVIATYTAICSRKSGKKGSFKFQNECVSEDIANFGTGRVLSTKSNKILHSCGCCNEAEIAPLIDDYEILEQDAEFCSVGGGNDTVDPICLPSDPAFQVCDNGSSGDVKGIRVCIDGVEEDCIDPFFQPVGSSDVKCGPCFAL